MGGCVLQTHPSKASFFLCNISWPRKEIPCLALACCTQVASLNPVCLGRPRSHMIQARTVTYRSVLELRQLLPHICSHSHGCRKQTGALYDMTYTVVNNLSDRWT